MDEERERRRGSSGLQDLLWILLAGCALAWLGTVTRAVDDVERRLHRNVPGIEGELLATLLILVTGLVVFAIRRWSFEQREASARVESESRYRALVEQVPAVTYTWDADREPGSVAAPYVSPQVERLLGYTQEEWQADPRIWHRRIHDDDRDRVLHEWADAVRTSSPFRSEYRIVARDGRLVWLRDEAVPVSTGPDGRRYQGVMYDITERKHVEEELVQAQEHFRALVEQIPAVVYIEDPVTGRNVYISPQAVVMFGYPPQEWMDHQDLWRERLHPEDRDWVIASNDTDTGDRWDVEYRTIHRDGHVVWIHNASVLIRDEDGEPLFWQGVAFDITERKLAEGRLREAEARYRTLVEQLPAVVYRDAVDDQSTALYVSPKYEQVFGYPAEARLNDPGFWIRHLHPADRERVLEESRRTNETGDPFIIDYRFIAKDGRLVWVRDEAALVYDAEGTPLYWQGVLLDVTERKAAEEALSRRDEVLQAVGFAAERFLGARDPVMTLPVVLERLGTAAGASRAYVFANEVLNDGALGTSIVGEWLAAGVTSIDEPSNHRMRYGRHLARWEATLGAGRPVVGVVRDFPEPERGALQSEGARSVAVVPVFDGDEWWGFLGFDDCLTERMWPAAEVEALKAAADALGAAIGRARAEHQRAEAEERYRSLVETISAVTYIDLLDDQLTTLYVSPQIESLFGYTVEDWIEDVDIWLRNVHPDDVEPAMEAIRRHNRDGVPLDIEYRLRAGDGTWRWVRDQATIVRDASGAAAFSEGLMADITALKETEEQLREAEQRYRAIVEHVPAAIYVDEPDGGMRTLYVSPQIEQIMGCSPERYIADPELWLNLMPDEHQRAEMRDTYLAAIRGRRTWTGEYLVRHPDGTEVWVHDETAFVLDEHGEPLFLQGVMYDITERKLAEQALEEILQRERDAAERLRALDELKNTFLAAVSHELRSPLTSILGLALTLEQNNVADEDRPDLLHRLASNARKLDRLLEDLLDIDRLDRGIVTLSYRDVDVGALVRRSVEALDALGERSIRVDTRPVAAPIDPAKIERVVENLVANAVRHTPKDAAIWVRVWPDPDGVVIAVEDDGPGVPAELREAIFEPFRQGPTSSPHSPGTGIGLALVAMFSELHGGRAWVQEREGGGASFRVLLPTVRGGGNGNGNGAAKARPSHPATAG